MIDDAEKAINMVREAPVLVFDTETSGVDWRRNFPIGYVLCSGPAEAVYIPVRHGGGGNLPGAKVPTTATEPIVPTQFERDLARAFQVRQNIVVGHHLKFDCHMAANAGIMLGRNLSCTQNLETLLDEYSRSYSLENCAERRGVQAKKGEGLYQHMSNVFGSPATKKGMSRFWELPGSDPAVTEYAEGDGVTTWQLYHAQMREIENQGLTRIAELENQLIWTLFRMERRGIRVNVKYLEQLLELIEVKVQDAQNALPKGFNVRSPVDIKKYLEETGHRNWPLTDLGNPSFVEAWLRDFPEGKNIVVVRKWTNLANSFIRPLIDEHVINGRVHANFNQLRADDTGTPARLSCSSPNLQQIPKRDKDIAVLFRKAFVADEGMEFNEADWSQCEPRLYAHYSKEPALIAGYNQTPFKDVHNVVAELLHVERDPTAKRMNMGIFTGMYPKTFAEHMGWPLDRATQAWNQWHSMFPAVREFQELAKQALLSRGYVKTILGRRLRLEHPRFAYRAVSKIIQGGNADIMKYFMLEIDRFLEAEGDENAHLLASVHDSLEWQNQKTKAGRGLSAEILRQMICVQVPPFNLRVPFVVEHHAGRDWATATFGKED